MMGLLSEGVSPGSCAVKQWKSDAAFRPQPKRDGPDDWPTPACLCAALTHDVPAIPEGSVWEP